MARLTIEADAAGNLKLESQGVPLEAAERLLLAALLNVQRELLARRVVQLQREGIVVTAKLPGDGGR